MVADEHIASLTAAQAASSAKSACLGFDVVKPLRFKLFRVSLNPEHFTNFYDKIDLGSAASIDRLIRLEINAHHEEVGAPINILELGGSGPRWLQNGGNCSLPGVN